MALVYDRLPAPIVVSDVVLSEAIFTRTPLLVLQEWAASREQWAFGLRIAGHSMLRTPGGDGASTVVSWDERWRRDELVS